jgi:hypothetical protein
MLRHCDRGSQYTSEQFQRLMARRRLLDEPISNVWDDATMESFFSSLKTERTACRMYQNGDDAKADVFDYFERFYNPKRRHSTTIGSILRGAEFGIEICILHRRDSWSLHHRSFVLTGIHTERGFPGTHRCAYLPVGPWSDGLQRQALG